MSTYRERKDDDLVYGRVQPQSKELEEAILGAVLVDYECIDILVSNLILEDFYFDTHQKIFRSILSLNSKKQKIDLLTVMSELKALGLIVDHMELFNLTSKVGSSRNIESHIEFLKNLSIKRQLIQMSTDAIQKAFNDENDSVTILTNLIGTANDLQNRTVIQKEVTFEQEFIQAVDECLSNEGKEVIGVKSGFNKFDSITSGFIAPDLTILAAGPGEGKSTFALNVAKNISLHEDGGDVAIFAYEMKSKQLIWKMMSDDLSVPVSSIRLGKFDKDYLQKTKLYKSKLHIFDRGSITLRELCSKVKVLAKKIDLKLIIIDYIQLVKVGQYHRKLVNKTDEVTVVSNELKQLALEVNVPILALSQLSRKEGRKGYTKSDLRDSGAIEQDADNIVFIFRPTEHGLKEYYIGENKVNLNEQTAIINLDKWRLGVTGEFEMKFNGACSRFEDIEPKVEEAPF